MAVAHVEFLVEEPSMETALRVLLPRALADLSFDVHSYQGKADLLQRLPGRLRGYSAWLPEDYRIVVVVDRDDDDCSELKTRLERIGQEAGIDSRTRSAGKVYQLVNRLAVEELEAWYFGDWDAVRSAYPKVPKSVPTQEKYRDPDAIKGGTWEAFERILQRAGYFRSGLRKIEAARAIAEHWQPQNNRSRSFQVFHAVLREMAT